jgi:hypothetical protein
MNCLDTQGLHLLALLVEKLEAVVPGHPETYFSYKDVHEELGLLLRGPTYGESLKHQGLTSLANWTVAKKMPAITGIIIDRTTFIPGEGYFRIFGKKSSDFQWWEEQIRLSQQFDWSPYL